MARGCAEQKRLKTLAHTLLMTETDFDDVVLQLDMEDDDQIDAMLEQVSAWY